MKKTDLTKLYKSYYSANPEPKIVEFEPAKYISIRGKGDPSEEVFLGSLQAIYSVVYTLKFTLKAGGEDFVVPKLEGLWWFDETKYGNISIEEAPTKVKRSEWEYNLLIQLPEFVTKEMTNRAIDSASEKKKSEKIKEVSFFEMHEGKCVQMLHTGPFDTESVSLKIINDYCKKNQLQKNGLHHEIYLSDFRRTSPEQLKTILREPIK